MVEFVLWAGYLWLTTVLTGERDGTDNMTGIVYTDEGGEEQSLLGKLVVTTDETGSSNFILQEVGGVDGSGGKSGRIMKFNLTDMPSFVLDTDDIVAEVSS